MAKVRALSLFVLVACAFFLGQRPAFSEEAKAGAPKVGFIDLQRALNESEEGKRAKTELESVIKERQASISEKVKARDKLREDLEKQAAALSEKARKAKAEELDKLEKTVDRLISDSNEELQKRQREKEAQILTELEVIIEGIGKGENYTVILPADVIIYAEDGIELTDRVIKLYDESKQAEEKKKDGDDKQKEGGKK